MLEMLGIAIASDTVKALVAKLLESLQEKATDKLIDTVSETLINTVNSKISNPDDVVIELNKIPELQHITTTQITKCFENISNSIIIAESPGTTVYKNCQIQLQADRNEIKAVIVEILATLPKDNPHIIRSLQPFLKKVENVIEECYDFESKKELLKNLIKERIIKSVDSNITETRIYDQALDIIPYLSIQELNLITLCFIIETMAYTYNDNNDRSFILISVASIMGNFQDIGNINNSQIVSFFNKHGMNFNMTITYGNRCSGVTNKNTGQVDTNFYKELFDIISSTIFIHTHNAETIFSAYCSAIAQNQIFLLIGKTHYYQKTQGT